MAWYFEEGCGTLKRVAWYFAEVGVVLCRGMCDTLKLLCGTLKRVVWYFEEDYMVFLEEGGVV